MTVLRHAAAAFAVVLAAGASHAAGLDIHADADAADVGLPVYPGAVKKADKGSDLAGFSFGVWGESLRSAPRARSACSRSARGTTARSSSWCVSRPTGPISPS